MIKNANVYENYIECYFEVEKYLVTVFYRIFVSLCDFIGGDVVDRVM
jgi:hypothetical protein